MLRSFFTLAILMVLVTGCASGTPVIPQINPQLSKDNLSTVDNLHRIWGEWTLIINKERSKVDIVPRREGRFHLNALKFLETDDKSFLEITGIKNNGDGTINLKVRLAHPFPEHPEYTGFDVKGIIIFNGSCQFWADDFPTRFNLPTPARISWCDLGDPEVLNADGYTPRWSVSYEYGDDLPIFRYREGKYTNGVPNGDLNAYLDFYTDEKRHIFRCQGVVERTYRIWLPPDEEVVAGYAVEACWEPPINVPVHDPFTDFPVTANQPEPYYLRVILNNGQTITDCDSMLGYADCNASRVEIKQWGNITFTNDVSSLPDGNTGYHEVLWQCDPPQDSVFWFGSPPCYLGYGNGRYKLLLISYAQEPAPPFTPYAQAYTLTDYEIDEP
jgi:hypothetical protein